MNIIPLMIFKVLDLFCLKSIYFKFKQFKYSVYSYLFWFDVNLCYGKDIFHNRNFPNHIFKTINCSNVFFCSLFNPKNMILEQKSVISYYDPTVRQRLFQRISNRCIRRARLIPWPMSSIDLTSCDYFSIRHLEHYVYSELPKTCRVSLKNKWFKTKCFSGKQSYRQI